MRHGLRRQVDHQTVHRGRDREAAAMARLRVTDPIGAYLGPVPTDKARITLHHLLTHTAGLADALGDDYEVLSASRCSHERCRRRWSRPPGREFHYSNLGYSVLAAIVEKVVGRRYEQFLAHHLFRPAGMTRTGYVLPHWRRSGVAVEYDRARRSTAAPTITRGRPTGRTGTCAATAASCRPRATCFAGAARSVATPSSRRPQEASYSPRTLGSPIRTNSTVTVGHLIDNEHGRIAWHDGGNMWSLAISSIPFGRYDGVLGEQPCISARRVELRGAGARADPGPVNPCPHAAVVNVYAIRLMRSTMTSPMHENVASAPV